MRLPVPRLTNNQLSFQWLNIISTINCYSNNKKSLFSFILFLGLNSFSSYLIVFVSWLPFLVLQFFFLSLHFILSRALHVFLLFLSLSSFPISYTYLTLIFFGYSHFSHCIFTYHFFPYILPLHDTLYYSTVLFIALISPSLPSIFPWFASSFHCCFSCFHIQQPLH